MARVTVPPLMRDVTGGLAQVEEAGDTVARLLHDLDMRYPGFEERLVVDGALDPTLIIVIDQRPAPLGLRTRISGDCHIRFLPAVSGG